MKKLAVVLLVLMLLLAALGWGFDRIHIVMDRQVYLREMTEADFSGGSLPPLEKLAEFQALKLLDLRDTGLTVSQYEALKQALPGCRILWSVPFQDGWFREETEALTISDLTEADIARLGYFPQLKAIQAPGCRNYDALMAMKAAYPELDVFYDVTIAGVDYPFDTEALVLKKGAAEELAQVIDYLPNLKTVEFTGETGDDEGISRLKAAYPGIRFLWNFTVCGVSTDSMAEELILSGIPMESVAEVETALKYFYNLQRVEMCGCGISSQEMDALWQRWPDTRFVWTVRVGRGELRTDVTAFIPYTFGYGMYNKLYDKDCTELKYLVDMVCLDMGHMGITDYSFLESMPRLQYLILADTPGTDFSPISACTEMIFLELFLTAFDDTALLADMTKLEDLNLSFSMVRDITPLLEMKQLQRLWLPGTMTSPDEQKALKTALPEAKIIFRSTSSTNEGWRKSPNYYKMRDLLGMWYLD